MSETENTNVANHTLAYLRRTDLRVQELLELFVRQQELISRLDRDMREGFAALQRDLQSLRQDMQGTQRDVREMKSDMMLMENRIVSAVSADHHSSARLNEHEARLDDLETQHLTP